MALYCQKACSQLVGQVGSSCTLEEKSVPCDLKSTNQKVKVEAICGFEISQADINAGTHKCDSYLRKFTCEFESITSPDCFEELPTGAVPTKASNDGTTPSISISVSVPSSTTSGTGPSTTTAPASDPAVVSTNSPADASIPEVNSTSTPKPNGISSGAAAGIGIGSAIAGAAISALVLLLLFGRYKKRHQKSTGYTNHFPNYNTDLGRPEKELPMSTKIGVVVTESYLPQPAEDDAIIGEFSKLRDNIKNHVQSFYITGPIDPQSLNRGVLREVSRDAGIQFSKLQDLLVNRTSRNSALRLCIGWMILSRCDGKGPVDTSLLPDEAAAVAALMSDIDYKDARELAHFPTESRTMLIEGQVKLYLLAN